MRHKKFSVCRIARRSRSRRGRIYRPGASAPVCAPPFASAFGVCSKRAQASKNRRLCADGRLGRGAEPAVLRVIRLCKLQKCLAGQVRAGSAPDAAGEAEALLAAPEQRQRLVRRAQQRAPGRAPIGPRWSGAGRRSPASRSGRAAGNRCRRKTGAGPAS